MLNTNLFIAAPFGNYIRLPYSIRIRGTFTLKKRPGIILQSLKTIRYTEKGWINKMEFRNPGIDSVSKNPNDIYSIGVVDSIDEWNELYYKLPSFMSLEINLGCPNVNHIMIPYDVLKKFVNKFRNIIVKVPGDIHWARDIIFNSYNEDVRIFDVCNTIPTIRGGLSGREVQKVSLPLIKEIKEDLPDIYAIGSGGIYTIDDVKRYQDVGTDGYALGTIFMTCPQNLFSVCNYIGQLLANPSQITGNTA